MGKHWVEPHKSLPGWETVHFKDGASINRPIQPHQTTRGCFIYWALFTIIGVTLAYFLIRFLAGMMF